LCHRTARRDCADRQGCDGVEPGSAAWSRGDQGDAYTLSFFVSGTTGKAGIMDWISDNFWTFMIIMLVILGALIGLLLFLRNKRPED
jgi:hypothetical protein